MELEKLDLKQLRDLQARVARAISGYESRRRQEAIQAIEAKAGEFGFALAELMDGSVTRKRRPATAKYANPKDATQTWTGRGRRPRWVEAELRAGKALADLAI